MVTRLPRRSEEDGSLVYLYSCVQHHVDNTGRPMGQGIRILTTPFQVPYGEKKERKKRREAIVKEDIDA